MPKTDKLTPKQKRFCQEYLKNGGNATQAALSAGYKPKAAARTGSENLQKPLIASFLQASAEKAEKNFEYGLKEHIADLDDMAEAARKMGDIRTALRAKELKGKVCGLYIEKHEVSGGLDISFSWGGDGDKD